MNRIGWIIILFGWLPFGELLSQDLQDTEYNARVGDQFFFDYRLHRNPVKIFQEQISGSDSLEWVHLYNGNPIITYSQGEFRYPEVDSLPAAHYKLDIQLQPYLNYSLGDFSNPFQSQIGLAPRIQANLSRGFYAVGQWYFPIQNEFRGQFARGHRPGEMGMGFDYLLQGKYAFSGFIGTFTGWQYGLNLEYLGVNKQGTFYYGFSYFLTGNYLYHELYYDIDPLNTSSGYVQLAYRNPRLDLMIRLIGDVYLSNEVGVTLEVLRQFGNTDIGFYAIQAQSGSNGGFFFRIPLWPRKFYTNKWLQVRLPHSYAFYYNVRSSVDTPRTRRYTNLFNELIRFNPNFLNHQLNPKE